MLRGKCFITGNLEIVSNAIMDPNTKIICMEDMAPYEISRVSIPGTYLLPPVEAKIAEADGNESKYDNLYFDRLSDNYSQAIISAFLARLYQGGSILFYLPDYGDNTLSKFIFFMNYIYGLHIGNLDTDQNIINQQISQGIPLDIDFYFDPNKIPLYLNMIYMNTKIMTWREYLYNYPINVQIDGHIMDRLLEEISPYGDNINEQIQYIYNMVSKIKSNIKLICSIQKIKEG